MFGLSFAEVALLGVIGLVVLGPKQLPEVARTIGRLLNELKRATGDLTNVLVDARDATQKSLIEARDEYNKVLEQAEQLETPPSADQSAPTNPPNPTDQPTVIAEQKTPKDPTDV